MSAIKVFGLGASRLLAHAIAAELGVKPALIEEREFEDGEHKARPLESVLGHDVYVVHALYADRDQSANDKLCRLLFFLATVRDHGAAWVTAVLPYVCYARKDRRTQPFDPVTMRYVAQCLESTGTDRVIALGIHNPAAFENAFRCRADLLEAHSLFANHLAPALRDRDVTILSPDAGGFKRADAFRRTLDQVLGQTASLGLMEKRRSGGVVSGEELFADVANRNVVIVDDLIGTGTTLLRAAQAVRAAGARAVHAVASHGLFVGRASEAMADSVFDSIVITDSVPPFRLHGNASQARVQVLPSAPLFSRRIRELHLSRNT